MKASSYTLKEIAKELNVSRATIDRVIHNRGGIGEETVERVRDFLTRVDYKPNKVGKSLAKRHQKNIYIILPDSGNEFFYDLKSGVQAAAAEILDYGFSVHILEVDKNSEEQLRLMKEVVEQGADAIAISPYEPIKFEDLINEAVKKDIPVITVNNDVVNSSRLAYIGTNYYKSGRVAGEVLCKTIKSGNIMILCRKSDYWQNQLRVTGFMEVIDSFPEIRISGSFNQFFDYNSSYYNMENLIHSNPNMKGILLLANEKDVISGVCKAISESAPRKIDVITFDLTAECLKEIENGHITATICQDPYSQGYYAIKVLFKYLFDNELPKKSMYLTKLDVIYKENLSNYGNELNGL